MDSFSSKQEIPLYGILDSGNAAGLGKYGYDGTTPISLFACEHKNHLISFQQQQLDMGADILYTATNGANRAILSKYGLEDKTEELNVNAAKITYDNFHGKAIIAGCITSSAMTVEPYGDYTFTEIMSVYRQQVQALSPYCDIFVIEGVPSMWNLRAAVIACKKEKKPVIATMTADEDGDSTSDTNVVCALIVLQSLGIDAFGISRTTPSLCAELIEELYPYANIPLIAKPCPYETDESGNTIPLSSEEFARALKKSADVGAVILGVDCMADTSYIAKIKELKNSGLKLPDTEKQDTTLVFATENQRFFLEADTTEFSPAIECAPDMTDEITEACSQNYDVLTVSINSPDDAIDFCRNMHMATLPVSFLSDDEISLKVALMLYNGRAIVDTNSLIEPERLERIAQKYGAVLY